MNDIEYGLILNSISDGVCVVSQNGIVTCFNKAAERITGHPSGKVIGISINDIFNPKQCQCSECLHKVMLDGVTLRDQRTCILGKSGLTIPILVNISPLHGKNSIIGAVMTFQDQTEVEILRKQIACSHSHENIITKNPKMQELLNLLPGISATSSSVLVLGESGTGKELLARAIHQLSERSDYPFVAVNCGAIPDSLLESELFGYKKGAFTGATRDKKGRFDLAGKGTLFLDEIGDVSPSMQVKLLRVLQEKIYEALGSEKSSKSRCRVIAATNLDLKKQIAENKFRQDLYYRINVIELRLPPLRDRLDDIVLLTRHFIDKINAEYGKKLESISQEAMKALMRYNYPGNIRELENIIERAYVTAVGNEVTVQSLSEEVVLRSSCPVSIKQMMQAPTLNTPNKNASSPIKNFGLSPEEEKELLLNTLEFHHGHRAKTASALGITTVTLWRKMKKFSL